MKQLALLCVIAVSPFASVDVLGQMRPNRPLRMVVPFEPGGSIDVVARHIAVPWGEILKQQIVIDNRGGAGGTLGATLVANATADGYTVLYGNLGPLSIGPLLYRKLGYDLFRDFAPVSLVGSSPFILCTSSTLAVQSVKELVALAKAKPGQLSYASSGVGSGLHLTAELFKTVAGVDMVHIPYKGMGQAAADIASGRIQVVVNTYANSVPHIKGGRIKVLMTGGSRRSAQLPDVPTGAEAGLPGFQSTAWHAVVVPAATPQHVVAHLQQTLAAALAKPELRTRLAAEDVEPIASTADALRLFLRTEAEKWGKLIKSLGIKE